MWLKTLCLILIANHVCGADEFLSQLYGLEQRNKVAVCLKPTATKHERDCSGALLHDQWVGVRAGCLRKHPLNHILVLRLLITGETCDNITGRYSSKYSRSARAVFYHPWADLAILYMDGPYYNLDKHPNSTKWTVSQEFKQHGTWNWMKQYFNKFALQRNPHYYYRMMERKMIANRSPLLVMFVTIVLPFAMLLLVFHYVIYYSGSTSKVSYKNLLYTKKASQV